MFMQRFHSCSVDQSQLTMTFNYCRYCTVCKIWK